MDCANRLLILYHYRSRVARNAESISRTYDELGRAKTKAVSDIEGKVMYISSLIISANFCENNAIKNDCLN